jgi:ATP-binding protein involved in chromosome partitioning
MFRQVGIPVLGVVENMSYFVCNHSGEALSIFGNGGGMELSAELHTHLLGQIPIDTRICTGGDTGKPLTLTDPMSAVGQILTQIASTLKATFYGCVANTF